MVKRLQVAGNTGQNGIYGPERHKKRIG